MKPIDPYEEFLAEIIKAMTRETDRLMLGKPRVEIDGKPIMGLVNFGMSHQQDGGFLGPTGLPLDRHELEAAMWRTVGIDIDGGEDG